MELQKYKYNRVVYFVDYRLQQFRSDTPIIEFLSFRDYKGDRILSKMIREKVAKLELLRL